MQLREAIDVIERKITEGVEMVQKNALNTDLDNIFNRSYIVITNAFVNDFGKGTKKDVDALGALAVVFYDVFLERASHIAGEDEIYAFLRTV
jgi:hypothetical protein